MGTHIYQDHPHYHLYIRTHYGATKEMPELFKYDISGEQGNVTAATVQDIMQFVTTYTNVNEPFTLFWKGMPLNDSAVKLRDIVVGGEEIPLYNGSIGCPIAVRLNKDIDKDVEGVMKSI